MSFELDEIDVEEVKAEVVETIEVPEKKAEQITSLAERKGAEMMAVDVTSTQGRAEITHAVETLGDDLYRRSQTKNEILSRRVGQLSAAGGENGDVVKGLEDLSIKMRDLDPSGLDFAKKGPLGGLFNPVRRYFERYKTADAEIADIVKSLDKGRKTLQQDNKTLSNEVGGMRDLTLALNQRLALAADLDTYLTDSIEKYRLENGDDEKTKFLEEEVLFPLRQKQQDMQQLLIVNQQGIVAMEVVRRNNLELIRAVDRAEHVTVAALRTAVTVAGALYNQKIVLEKVEALNAVTNDMISATSRMLKEQGVAIQRQATEAAISPDTLKAAFSDTLSALDDISEFKQRALPQMAETIGQFRELADEGEKRLQQMEQSTGIGGKD